MIIRTESEHFGSPIKYFCLYCDQDITPSEGLFAWGWLDCNYCAVTVRFITSGSLRAPEIAYIQFHIDKGLIELNLLDNKTSLIERNLLDITLSLNYLIDINPDNCEEWSQRLSKLKAFS